MCLANVAAAPPVTPKAKKAVPQNNNSITILPSPDDKSDIPPPVFLGQPPPNQPVLPYNDPWKGKRLERAMVSSRLANRQNG